METETTVASTFSTINTKVNDPNTIPNNQIDKNISQADDVMNLDKNISSVGRKFETILEILNSSAADDATKYQSNSSTEKGKNVKLYPMSTISFKFYV